MSVGHQDSRNGWGNWCSMGGTMLTTLSTSSMLLLTSKGQKRPTSQLMASCDDWLRRRTTFCPRLYNRRLFELLPGITGLCWTPQNDSNYEAQESLGTNQTKSPQHDQRKLLSVNTLSRSSTRSSPPSKISFVPSSAFSLRLVMYLAGERGEHVPAGKT